MYWSQGVRTATSTQPSTQLSAPSPCSPERTVSASACFRRERDPVDLTLPAHQSGVQRYVNAGGPPGPALQAFLGWVVEAVPGGTVLEVGSGSEWDANQLESLGLRA